jgi:hypothetical protein
MAIDIEGVKRDFKNLAETLGRGALHALYPKEFEFYMFALELTTFDGDTIDYLTFPVMPSNITKAENNRINVKKSFGAVTVINSKSFTPSDLTISGTFGRSFKILIESGSPTIFNGLKYSYKTGIWDPNDIDQSYLKNDSRNFNPAIKTGYGVIQALKSIIAKSAATDDKGRSMKLYCYNLGMGESYLCVPTPNPLTIKLNDKDNNMLPSYSLSLTTIALITGTTTQGKSSSGIRSVIGLDYAQKYSSTFVSVLRKGLP